MFALIRAQDGQQAGGGMETCHAFEAHLRRIPRGWPASDQGLPTQTLRHHATEPYRLDTSVPPQLDRPALGYFSARKPM